MNPKKILLKTSALLAVSTIALPISGHAHHTNIPVIDHEIQELKKTSLKNHKPETREKRIDSLIRSHPTLSASDVHDEIDLSDPSTPTSIINKPINIFVHVDGKGKMLTTNTRTLEQALEANGIKLGRHDKTSSPRNSIVTDKQIIIINRVKTELKAKERILKFKTIESESPVACEVGETSKIITKGRNGVKVDHYKVVVTDGKKSKPQKVKTIDKVKKVDEVKADCITPEPVVEESSQVSNDNTPDNDRSSSSTSTPESPKVTISGTKEDWLRAAGIPESAWPSAIILIQRESSWNPNAVNPSSGSCGLVQALPCSKIPGNWRDPVTALKWGNSYVTERYSTWDLALQHSYNHGWY